MFEPPQQRGPTISILGEAMPLPALAATIAIGIAGALAARAVGTPLPWLFGAVLAVGGAGLSGLRIAGSPVRFPIRLRIFFVPIIGVAIGGAFTPELIEAATGWWPTLVALLVYIPLAHAVGYLLYRRVAGYDRTTAYFAAMPGGLIEAIDMGEKAGGDPATLNLLQFARLITCILVVPLAIMAYEGAAVGSAAGLVIGEGDGPLGILDVCWLVAAGALGFLAARRLRMPAAIITGPIVASGAVHLAGLTDADPPGVLVALTQLVVGIGLGVRFAVLERRAAMKGLGWAFVAVGAVLVLAVGFGAALSTMVPETTEAVLLAYAPGGVIEMSLIALSLKISVVFVSAHHVARILWTVVQARWVWSRISAREG